MPKLVYSCKYHLEITSAPLRNELVNTKQKSIQVVSKDIDTEVMDDIVFI